MRRSTSICTIAWMTYEGLLVVLAVARNRTTVLSLVYISWADSNSFRPSYGSKSTLMTFTYEVPLLLEEVHAIVAEVLHRVSISVSRSLIVSHRITWIMDRSGPSG
jgi:hypothetical protein